MSNTTNTPTPAAADQLSPAEYCEPCGARIETVWQREEHVGHGEIAKLRARAEKAEQRVADLKFALGESAGWFDRFKKAEQERDALRVRLATAEHCAAEMHAAVARADAAEAELAAEKAKSAELDAEQNIGVCEISSDPHEQGEHAYEGPETQPCRRWMVMTPSEIVEHFERLLKRHRDHFAEWAKKWADANQDLEAKRLLAQGTLDALTTEAQAMPRAVHDLLEIPSCHHRDYCECWRKHVTAAIEHDRLVSVRRAQLEREGLRKALEAARGMGCYFAHEGTRDERDNCFDRRGRPDSNRGVCFSCQADAALAAEPASLLRVAK